LISKNLVTNVFRSFSLENTFYIILSNFFFLKRSNIFGDSFFISKPVSHHFEYNKNKTKSHIWTLTIFQNWKIRSIFLCLFHFKSIFKSVGAEHFFGVKHEQSSGLEKTLPNFCSTFLHFKMLFLLSCLHSTVFCVSVDFRALACSTFCLVIFLLLKVFIGFHPVSMMYCGPRSPER
jgi:hypothetical protein